MPSATEDGTYAQDDAKLSSLLQSTYHYYCGNYGALSVNQFHGLCADAQLDKASGGPLPEEVLRTTAMRHAVRRGPERAPSLDLRAFTAAIMDLHALYNPLPGGGSLLSRVASLAQDAGPNHASQSTARDANSDAHLLSSQPSPNTSPRPSSSGSMDSGNSIPVVFPLKTLANNNKAPNGNLGAPSRSVQGAGAPRYGQGQDMGRHTLPPPAQRANMSRGGAHASPQTRDRDPGAPLRAATSHARKRPGTTHQNRRDMEGSGQQGTVRLPSVTSAATPSAVPSSYDSSALSAPIPFIGHWASPAGGEGEVGAPTPAAAPRGAPRPALSPDHRASRGLPHTHARGPPPSTHNGRGSRNLPPSRASAPPAPAYHSYPGPGPSQAGLREAWAAHGVDGLEAVYEGDTLLMEDAAAALSGSTIALRLLDRITRLEAAAASSAARYDQMERQVGSTSMQDQVASLQARLVEVEAAGRIALQQQADKLESVNAELKQLSEAHAVASESSQTAKEQQDVALQALQAALAGSEAAQQARITALEEAMTMLRNQAAARAAAFDSLDARLDADKSAHKAELEEAARGLRAELASTCEELESAAAQGTQSLRSELAAVREAHEAHEASVSQGIQELRSELAASTLAALDELTSHMDAKIAHSQAASMGLEERVAAVMRSVMAGEATKSDATQAQQLQKTEAALGDLNQRVSQLSLSLEALEGAVGAMGDKGGADAGQVAELAAQLQVLTQQQAGASEAAKASGDEIQQLQQSVEALRSLAQQHDEALGALRSEQAAAPASEGWAGAVQELEERLEAQQRHIDSLAVDMLETTQALQEQGVRIRDLGAASAPDTHASQTQAEELGGARLDALAQELSQLTTAVSAVEAAVGERLARLESTQQQQQEAAARLGTSDSGPGGEAMDPAALSQRVADMEAAATAQLDNMRTAMAELATAVEAIQSKLGALQAGDVGGAAGGSSKGGAVAGRVSARRVQRLSAQVEGLCKAMPAVWVALDVLNARLCTPGTDTAAVAAATPHPDLARQLGEVQAQVEVLRAQSKDRERSSYHRSSNNSLQQRAVASLPGGPPSQQWVSQLQLESVYERLATLEGSAVDMPGIMERLDLLQHAMQQGGAQRGEAGEGAADPAATHPPPPPDMSADVEALHRVLTDLIPRVSAVEAAVMAVAADKERALGARQVKIMEPSVSGSGAPPRDKAGKAQVLKLTRNLLKKILDRLGALEGQGRALWVAHDVVNAAVCGVRATLADVAVGTSGAATAQQAQFLTQFQAQQAFDLTAAPAAAAEGAGLAAVPPAVGGELGEAIQAEVARVLAPVAAEVRALASQMAGLEGRDQSVLEAVQGLLEDIGSMDTPGSAGFNPELSTSGVFQRSASRARSTIEAAMPNRSVSAPGFPGQPETLRSPSVRWQLQAGMMDALGVEGGPSDRTTPTLGGNASHDGASSSNFSGGQVPLPEEGGPTPSPGRSRFNPTHQSSGRSSMGGSASLAVRGLEGTPPDGGGLSSPAYLRDFRASFGSTDLHGATGLEAGGGVDTPTLVPRVPPVAVPSRPDSPTSTRERASLSDPQTAKDIMKQLYEMQKVLVESSRRHNKLGDRVAKLEKSAKNRLDIQEKVFVKLARQVDELNRIRDQLPLAATASKGLVAEG